MHAWYHQNDYLILFKMVPYLLWLCHRGKGSISKYGIRSRLKSCKMNTSGHEKSIKNMSFRVELCLLFSAGQLINSRRMRCPGGGAGTWVVHPDTEPWSSYWNQWALMKFKPLPLHLWTSMQIKPLPLHLFYVFVVVNVVNVLWD